MSIVATEFELDSSTLAWTIMIGLGMHPPARPHVDFWDFSYLRVMDGLTDSLGKLKFLSLGVFSANLTYLIV